MNPARTPSRHRTVTAPGGDLAVYEYGHPQADTIVLIPGITDTHRIWNRVATGLADSFHVVTYDVRGHGRSSAPTRTHRYRLPHLADDLFAVLDAVSPRTPVHLAGHGWGAIQLWYALGDPRANTRIASATALSAPHLDHLALALRDLRCPRSPWWRLPRLSWLVLGRRLLHWPRLRARVLPQATTWPSDLLAGARIVAANLAHHLRHPRPQHTAVPVQLILDRADTAALPSLRAHIRRDVDRLWLRELPADPWLPLTEPLLVVEAIANFIDDQHTDHRPIHYTPR